MRKPASSGGLDGGGDDYITKPFRLGELCSRIRAQLRRGAGTAREREELRSGPLRVDLTAGRAYLDGRVLELTAAEYRLLCLLMANEGRTLPRGRILDVLWDGNGNFVDDNTLSVYIRRLREKTEKDPSRPRMLLTVRGIGYRWEAEKRIGKRVTRRSAIYFVPSAAVSLQSEEMEVGDDRNLQDRQERGFLMFLAVFCILLPVLGILGSLWQAQGIRDALLGREARLVSGMLESGLSEETAATILSRTEISQEGEALLRRTGRTQESLAWLYPEVRQAAGRTALFSCMGAGVLGAVLFSGAVLFLKRREALYEQAAGILSRSRKGIFPGICPEVERGRCTVCFRRRTSFPGQPRCGARRSGPRRKP